MERFPISIEYLENVLMDLLSTPSPTGDTEWAVSFVEQELESIGMQAYRTRKGSLVATREGLRWEKPRAVSAHIDTLGAMVSQVKPSGRVKMTPLNGVMWPTLESEGVWIQTRTGNKVRGSIVFENGSAHVNKLATTAARTAENLEIRLDVRTDSAEETRVLGVEVGDFVYFDPRPEKSESGFIRSRFLDDKAGVACVLAALKALNEQQFTPAQTAVIHISVHEEVGHGGMDGLPPDLAELVVVDMAAIGEGMKTDEFHCGICLKDSSGPYSKPLSDRLRLLAERIGIDVRPEVYPYYGSDGSAYWRAGGQAEVALIGPGVDTSHGYERTHIEALHDTALLIAEYLAED